MDWKSRKWSLELKNEAFLRDWQNIALKLNFGAFLRDFFQKWSFEEALKLQNKAFLRKSCGAELQKALRHCQLLNDFDFRTVQAPQRGANFADIFAADPPQLPFLGAGFCEPAKPQNYGKTQHFVQLLPAKLPHFPHVLQRRCETWEILAGRNCAKCCVFP